MGVKQTYNSSMMLSNQSRLFLAILWALSMLLFPLLLLQGIHTRRTALRLPDGEPPNEGEAGSGHERFRILGLGDSVIAGTGLKRMADSVTAQLAQAIGEQTSVTCTWTARGVNGHALIDLIHDVESMQHSRYDLIVVSVGVNDVTRLTGLLKWQLQLTRLIPLLTERTDRVVFLGVPPMEHFTALPQPLRWVLGIRAAMLDKSLKQAAELLPQIDWLEIGMKFDAEHLAEDGYHPNEIACREIATDIASFIHEKSD